MQSGTVLCAMCCAILVCASTYLCCDFHMNVVRRVVKTRMYKTVVIFLRTFSCAKLRALCSTGSGHVRQLLSYSNCSKWDYNIKEQGAHKFEVGEMAKGEGQIVGPTISCSCVSPVNALLFCSGLRTNRRGVQLLHLSKLFRCVFAPPVEIKRAYFCNLCVHPQSCKHVSNDGRYSRQNPEE
jgi:hypothetical protein